ncbi:MAG: xanthine dehydrogenase accessory protein XdhC [Burkholderiales bacterium]
MTEWLQALDRLGERGVDAVLVAVLSGSGSTPRDAGAKMVVASDGVHGTIGGGELEFQALEIARGMLRAGDGRAARRFPLGAALGQICGGAANLVFERVPAGAEWVRVAADWHERGKPCVLVTPEGESEGGHLLVGAEEAWGSLGATARDAQAVDTARRQLAATEEGPRVLELGGSRAVFEALRPSDFNVFLFGAGHVGRAIARVLGVAPCRVTWVDGRAHEFPDEIAPNVRRVVTEAAVAEAARAPAGSYFLVMTHSHALDFELVEAILRRADFAFCGMIGSGTKRRTFENGLVKNGLGADALARFSCPIGIAGIQGKEPGAIAIAVAAELLQLHERAAAARRQAGVAPV